MAQDYAASISGQVIRITKLNSDGTLAVGASGSYVTKSFISVSLTPEYEAGAEFIQKAADGSVCVTFKQPDTLKRVTLSVAICNPDADFTAMVTGGSLLGNSDGWAAPSVGVDGNPNGVALEVWSKAIVNGKPAATNPYWHWIFPYTKLHINGARMIGNDILATAFDGWGIGNSGFGGGPATPAWPYMADRAYAYARTDTIPAAIGYQAVTQN